MHLQAQSSENDFLTFTFSEQTFEATINDIDHFIDIEVAYNSDLTNLTPTFTLSNGAITDVSSGSARDFSSELVYTVTAEDGSSTQDWSVKVWLDPVSNWDDTAYYPLDGNGNDISSNVYNGTITGTGTSADRFGKDLALNEGAEFQYSQAFNIFNQSSYTVSFWIKIVSVTSGNVLLSPAISLSYESGSSEIRSQFALEGGSFYTGPATSVTSGVWEHYVISVSGGGDIITYRNAVEEANVSGTSNYNFESGTITLGDADANFEIDDFIVFPEPLSAGDIANLYAIQSDGFYQRVKPIFTEFNLEDQLNDEQIKFSNRTIQIQVGTSVDLTNIDVDFTTIDNATASIGGVLQESGVTQNDLTNPLTYTFQTNDGFTNQDWTVTTLVVNSTETEFLTFSIPEQTGDATINTTNHSILVEVASGTDLTRLTPTFTLSNGATSSTASGVSLDFSSDVTYTVTAEDGTTTQDWTVTVTENPNTETDFLTFSISEQIADATINTTDHSIQVEVSNGTDLTNLIPTFLLSFGATSNPESGISQDFSSNVTYSVTAEDGVTEQGWNITVTEAQGTSTDFLTFTVMDQVNSPAINTSDHTIFVEVGSSTDLRSLAPTFTLSDGATSSIESGATQDFSEDVTYSITAEDGTTQQDWIITILPRLEVGLGFRDFSVPNQIGYRVIDNINSTVHCVVSRGTDLTNLTPVFTVAPGNTVSPASGIAQDFSSPVSYRLTSEDGSESNSHQVYISEEVALDFLSFNLVGQVFPSTIDTTNHTIDVPMPFGTDLTSLTVSYNLHAGATANVDEEVNLDFSSPVTITITADNNGSSQDWVVTARPEPVNFANLTAYYPFDGEPNDISGNAFHGTFNFLDVNTDRFEKIYALSGDAEFTHANAINLLNQSSYTISFWIKVINDTDGNILRSPYLSLTFDSGSDEILSSVTTDGGGSISGPNIALTVGDWAHCIFSSDGMEFVSYLNGNRYAGTNPGSYLFEDGSFIFGDENVFTELDDLIILSTSVTSQEATALHANQVDEFYERTRPLFYDFNIEDQVDVENINFVSRTITAIVPAGTDVTNLTTGLGLIDGATATINGVLQESGVTTNDFSNDVTYTFTSEDGFTSQDWVIRVTADAFGEDPLALVSTSPMSNATGFSPDANIVLTFNNVVSEFIDGSQLSVRSMFSGGYDLGFSGGGTNELTITHTEEFLPGDLVTVTLTDDLVPNGYSFQFTVASNAANSLLSFSESLIIDRPGSTPRYAEIGDFDGDGDIDILTNVSGESQMVLFTNDGNSSPNFAQSTFSVSSNYRRDINLTAFQEDRQHLDVLIAGNTGGFAIETFNVENQNFTETEVLSTTGDGSEKVLAGDFNNDGIVDVITLQEDPQTVTLFLNNAANSTFTSHEIAQETGMNDVLIGDIDLDGDLDIIGQTVTDGISVFKNDNFASPTFAKENFTLETSGSIGEGGAVFAVGDINGDSRLDILTISAGSLHIMENDGTGSNFSFREISNGGTGSNYITLADLNDDGDLDIISRESELVWYENDGDATPSFTRRIIDPGSTGFDEGSPGVIQVADVNGDFLLDVLHITFDQLRVYFADTTAASVDTDFLSFSFDGIETKSLINTNSHTISAIVPFGTDKSSLTPIFTLSTGATSNMESGVSQSFGGSVAYSITAVNESTTQDWAILVNEDLINTGTLQAYYPFDRNGLDVSGNGLSGNISNSNYVADRFGNENSAFHSNGSTFQFSYPSSSDFFPDQAAYIVSFWIKIEEQISGSIFSSGSIDLTYEHEAGTIQSTINTQSGEFVMGPLVSATVGDWQHITFVITSGETFAIRNGQLENQDFPERVLVDEGGPIEIGASEANFIIDDLAIFHGFYNAAQGQDLYEIQSSLDFISLIPYFTEIGVSDQIGNEVINRVDRTIELQVIEGTDLSDVEPHFRLNFGATSDYNSEVSGDFSNPVTFRVTSLGGMVDDWLITVTDGSSSSSTATDILSFELPTQLQTATIDATNHTVNVTVAQGTDVTNLSPTMTISAGATISPASGVERDFSNTLEYTVTAQDGTTSQVWNVSVTVSETASSETDITSFTLPNQIGNSLIATDNHTIDITMPIGIDFSNLAPSIDLSTGATVNPTNGTPQDFTATRIYSVTAQDLTTNQDWEIRTAQEANVDPTAISLDNTRLLAITGPDQLVGNISVTDENEFDQHTIFLVNSGEFSLTGNQLFTSRSLSEGNYVATIVAQDLASGRITINFTIEVAAVETSNTISIGTSISDYRIIGMPTDQVEVSSVLTNLESSKQGVSWRILNRDTNGAYFDFNTTSQFLAGKGYWILSDQEVSVQFEHDPVTLDSEGNFNMTLRSGWNLISNPFIDELNWNQNIQRNINEGNFAASDIQTGVITYAGAYSSATSLDLFQGAWVNVTSSSNITVVLQNPSASLVSGGRQENTNTQELRLTLSNGDRVSTLSGFSINNMAAFGRDPYDQTYPPPVSEDRPFRLAGRDGIDFNSIPLSNSFSLKWEVVAPGTSNLNLSWEIDQVNQFEEGLYLILRGQEVVSMKDTDGIRVRHGDPVEIVYGTDDPRIIVQYFPNPVQDLLNVKINSLSGESLQEIRIQTYDISGKIVIDKEFANQQEIELSTVSLNDGLYLVHTWIEGKLISRKKVMVQHN